MFRGTLVRHAAGGCSRLEATLLSRRPAWHLESLSSFRQITTSLGRLLAFIRRLLDVPARAALLHALLRSRRGDGLCGGRVDVGGAHVIFARASRGKGSQ